MRDTYIRKLGNFPGFTLVELLVVIGIVTVLVALLMPVLATARRASGQAACASNLRQWAIALNMYADQNHDWIPRRGDGIAGAQTISRYNDWYNELPPLLGRPTYQQLVKSQQMPMVDDRSIWICPQLYGAPNRFGFLFGYAMNMALSVEIASLPDRIDKIGSSSTMVFMADGAAGYCSTVPYCSSANNPAPYNPVARHNNFVNVAFVDGHVSAYSANYLGCTNPADASQPNACNQQDVRWYWYTPGPSPAPWTGP